MTGYFGAHDKDVAKKVYAYAWKRADHYDAVQDTPWFVLYKELDKRYPGAKFILTTRPAEKWIKSIVTHFKGQYIATHAWIYQVDKAQGNEDTYIRVYEQHNRDVKEYFKDRPEDLLERRALPGAPRRDGHGNPRLRPVIVVVSVLKKAFDLCP